MKALLISAALICGVAAYAQEPAPSPVSPPADAATAPAPSGEAMPMPSPAEGVTQQGTVPSGEAVAPPGTNEPPMTVPAGTPVPDQNAALAPQPATTSYPPCTRKVTDRCIQTYERKNKRG
jgi:hypothetical protein